MSLKKRTASGRILPLLLWPLALAGCETRHDGGSVSGAPEWVKSRGAEGKVLLIVSVPETEAAKQGAELGEIRTIAADIIGHLPNTMLVKGGDTASGDPSDQESLALAKAAGADSICVLNVTQYSAVFWIAFSPLFECRGETRVLYNLRLIDAHTGGLLAHAVTDFSVGGQFVIRTHDDLKRDFAYALRHDLTPHETPPDPATTRSASARE